MGLVEKTAVTAFLDKYYDEHPLDNSYEGILARRSGLTKEAVVSTLDLIEVFDFVANYEPKRLGPEIGVRGSDIISIAILEQPIVERVRAEATIITGFKKLYFIRNFAA